MRENSIFGLLCFSILIGGLNSLTVSMTTITVIGSNGKTGRKVVSLALKKGYKVNAICRGILTLDDNLSANNNKLKVINYDIKDLISSVSLSKVFRESKAVIFAASTSKLGGTPDQIDRDGVINVAKICIENQVPRLVIVSSGAVTKPFSPVYLFLNLFGGIMKAKIEGENSVRKLYLNLPEKNQIG